MERDISVKTVEISVSTRSDAETNKQKYCIQSEIIKQNI